jgi:hypothetical protein
MSFCLCDILLDVFARLLHWRTAWVGGQSQSSIGSGRRKTSGALFSEVHPFPTRLSTREAAVGRFEGFRDIRAGTFRQCDGQVSTRSPGHARESMEAEDGLWDEEEADDDDELEDEE